MVLYTSLYIFVPEAYWGGGGGANRQDVVKVAKSSFSKKKLYKISGNRVTFFEDMILDKYFQQQSPCH